MTASISTYGFARLRWPERDLIFVILLTTLMLPYAGTLIPTFLIWSGPNLLDTIVVFLVSQRYFVEGIALTGIKG